MAKWVTPLLLLCGSSAWTQTLEIRVRIFNQAAVLQSVIASAEQEAAWALGTAAVGVRWVDCAGQGRCDQELGRGEFAVVVQRAAPASSFARGAEALGLALLPSDEPGWYAVAYYDEIRRLADSSRTISSGELLGYVIAHEIGHLLLGPQHKNDSVMQARWGPLELRSMAQRKLRFDRSQRLDRKDEGVASDRALRSVILPR